MRRKDGRTQSGVDEEEEGKGIKSENPRDYQKEYRESVGGTLSYALLGERYWLIVLIPFISGGRDCFAGIYY